MPKPVNFTSLAHVVMSWCCMRIEKLQHQQAQLRNQMWSARKIVGGDVQAALVRKRALQRQIDVLDQCEKKLCMHGHIFAGHANSDRPLVERDRLSEQYVIEAGLNNDLHLKELVEQYRLPVLIMIPPEFVHDEDDQAMITVPYQDQQGVCRPSRHGLFEQQQVRQVQVTQPEQHDNSAPHSSQMSGGR